MKRYTRRKSHKVKILFSLLFLIILCMMAGKVLNSDFTLLPLDNITHHVASGDNGWNLILVNRNSYIPDDYIENTSQKIEVYQNIAISKTEEDIQDVEEQSKTINEDDFIPNTNY